MAKKVVIIALVAVVAAAAIATVLHVTGIIHLPPSTVTAPATTTSVPHTATAPASQSVSTSATSPASKTSAPSSGCRVFVVYEKFPTEAESKVIDRVIKTIESDLSRAGLVCSGYKLVGKDYFVNLNIPAYPAVLISREAPKQFREAFVKVGDYWLLKPPIFYYLLRSYGANATVMTYRYSSVAYIVSGSLSYSKISINETYVSGSKAKYLLDFLSWTSVTSVKLVKIASPEEFKDLPYYPAIVIKPEGGFNISLYSPLFIPVNQYYVYKTGWFANSVLPFLERVSGKTVLLETHLEPDISGPHLGSRDAPVKVLIFEDVHCPFCAKFYNVTLPKVIKNYVDKGLVEFVFKDLVVHPSSRPLQEALICFYEKTGDDMKYFKTYDTLYRIYMSGGRVDMAVLSKILGVNATKLASECNATKVLMKERAQAEKYGALGTPTFVIWNSKKKVGLVVVGFMNYDEFSKVLDEVLRA